MLLNVRNRENKKTDTDFFYPLSEDAILDCSVSICICKKKKLYDERSTGGGGWLCGEQLLLLKEPAAAA